MQATINGNDTVKYCVVVEGKTVSESVTRFLAEQFVASLPSEQRIKAQVITMTNEGQQLLFG